ncbi:MAG: IS21 family transposase [Planctomycetes bacterium]|nr:IS21 family transposase [Planctomycetota bacterium]
MPAKRLSMRKIRETLRLSWAQGFSQRKVSRSISVSQSTVAECLLRARAAGLSWPLDPALDDAALEVKLYPPASTASKSRALPGFKHIHRELRRKGVTLMLLWQEYKQDHPDDGYHYSQFCELYRKYKGQLNVVMRQEHRAGEKMFIDFSGDGIAITDPHTGVVSKAELLIATLGASNYTYAEAFPSQQLPCWIEGHIHAYEYFEGVAKATVPDNTKTAVTHPCHFEPDLNATYLDMARHYGTAILPARVRKPRDKAQVEGAVLIAQRWILAALRNHTFFSIEQANEAISEKLEELNGRRFQKLDTTRKELFETLDKPALLPLPGRRYEFADWKTPRVNIDYHVEVDKHYYSVPYSLVHKYLDARFTATCVELFHKGRRVASHVRSFEKGKHTTLKEHMPKSHQQYLEWTPTRILAWANQTGEKTAALAQEILNRRAYPEQGYRSCLGLLRLGKAYGKDRLEAACERALYLGAYAYKSVKSILRTGLDRQPLLQAKGSCKQIPVDHKNIRGAIYYR